MTVVSTLGRSAPSPVRPEHLSYAPRLAVRPAVADAVLAVAAFGVGVLQFSGGPRGGPPAEDAALVLLVLAAAALVGRRIAPLAVWATASALTAGMVLLHGTGPTLAAPMLVAVYTVGRSAGVATTAACGLVSGALYAVALASTEGTWLDERGDYPALTVLALLGAAAAVGVAVRGQREALDAARARALQAELTREEEAVRRVTDERLRIARELHDVVAHHISVVNVQAGVARHLMDTQPDQARAALTAVREASRTVLAEMTSVVGLLRTEDGGAPTEPAPGLTLVPTLIGSLRPAGLDVSWRTEGDSSGLSAIADLTAYRVVQESLTNALKYGTGTADLLVSHDPGEVVVEVHNPFADPSVLAAGGGHGLIGMRERLDAVSGRLTAGPDGRGGWLVRAVIPREPR